MGGSASPEEADGGWGGRREPLGTEHVGACTGQFLHRYLFLLWNCFEILATTASIFFFISLSLCVVHIPYLAACPDKPCDFGRASKTTPLRCGNRRGNRKPEKGLVQGHQARRVVGPVLLRLFLSLITRYLVFLLDLDSRPGIVHLRKYRHRPHFSVPEVCGVDVRPCSDFNWSLGETGTFGRSVQTIKKDLK